MRIVAAIILALIGIALLVYGYFGFMFAEDATNVSSARFSAITAAVFGLGAIVAAVLILRRGPEEP